MNQAHITQKLLDWRDSRGFGRQHSEPELARSIMIEAAELNRLYQWTGDEMLHVDIESMSDEIADIVIYTLYLCEKRGIDLEQAILAKMEKNSVKHPAVDARLVNNF